MMLRTGLRQLPTTTSRIASTRSIAARLSPLAQQQHNGQQTRQAHAISNPTLANIEKRWEEMAPQEQADLWMALRDRMKVDWTELTLQEKKAGMCSIRLSLSNGDLFEIRHDTDGRGGSSHATWKISSRLGLSSR